MTLSNNSNEINPPNEIENSKQAIINEAKTKFGARRFAIIYRLYCSNTKISYVGHTCDTHIAGKDDKLTRSLAHFSCLKRNCHPYSQLQAAWNSSKGKTFKDEILEIVHVPEEVGALSSKQKIAEREKYWQAQFNTQEHMESSNERNWHYQIKKEELLSLKEFGIINNSSFVYFALKLKNPWCDRPIKIYPAAFAIEWNMKESSVYAAIAELQEKLLISISRGEVTLQWNGAIDSTILEKNQDSRIDSTILENRAPEPLISEDFPVSQTNTDLSQTNTNLSQTNTNSIQTNPPLPPKGKTESHDRDLEIFHEDETAEGLTSPLNGEAGEPREGLRSEETSDLYKPRPGGHLDGRNLVPPPCPCQGVATPAETLCERYVRSNEQEKKSIQESTALGKDPFSVDVEQKINKKTRFNEEKADWLIDYYNKNKPPTWSQCRKCTTKIYRDLSKLYAEFGNELADRWRDALIYPLEINHWWQSGNNRSILTLLRSDRVTEWSDAVVARRAPGVEKLMSEQEMLMAKDFAATMAAIADL